MAVACRRESTVCFSNLQECKQAFLAAKIGVRAGLKMLGCATTCARASRLNVMDTTIRILQSRTR